LNRHLKKRRLLHLKMQKLRFLISFKLRV